jgi:hypothetical protein
MSKIDAAIKRIKTEHIGLTSKRVLFVEGPDDVAAYSVLLAKKTGNSLWEQEWLLYPAGSKKNVIEFLAAETDWIGLVDRDEWSDDLIAAKQLELPNLLVLPRFCLESYLIDPDELWDAFPQVQKDKVPGGIAELSATILGEKAKWLRHGVLWSVINPLWGGLRALGFKEALLDVETAQQDALIQETLAGWHDFLRPHQIFETFQARHAEVNAKGASEQVHLWIHGKLFYPIVVHPALDLLLGHKSAEARRLEIFRTRTLPEDLAPLWAKMGL